MHQEWRELLQAWSVGSTLVDESFEQIRYSYNSPGRFYHTLDHIGNVLETVTRLRSHADNLNAVYLAAWLHDVIYDSKASDNEERSAEFAERLCEKLAIPERVAVASLILKTKTHDAADDQDAQVLIDADLAILGESDSVYRIYAKNIRKEYGWVPEPDYRSGRRRVLERLMAKPRIFHLLDDREAPARRNITVEIGELSGD